MSSPITILFDADEPIVCVVADGMGGHAAGEVASTMAVQESMRAVGAMQKLDQIADALIDINRRLFEESVCQQSLRGMGATIAGVAIKNGTVCIFNVGDCRVYTQDGKYLQLLSEDDTPNFHASEVSGRTGTFGHGVTQCLGGVSVLTTIAPHVVFREITKSMRFLLCSDGLTDMLDQDDMEACIDDDTKTTVAKLIEAALLAGGTDNISIICMDVEY